MTKVLDVLEAFLNLHSFRYLRLDDTTKTDDRQRKKIITPHPRHHHDLHRHQPNTRHTNATTKMPIRSILALT